MSKFESSIRQIAHSQQAVYDVLSRPASLALLRDRLPEDKAQSLSFDDDTITANVPPVGPITLRIIERDEPKCIKLETVQSPVPFHFWIQMLPTGTSTSKMRLTVDADIPIMLRAMVSKPLGEGIEKIADALEKIDYTAVSETLS